MRKQDAEQIKLVKDTDLRRVPTEQNIRVGGRLWCTWCTAGPGMWSATAPGQIPQLPWHCPRLLA